MSGSTATRGGMSSQAESIHHRLKGNRMIRLLHVAPASFSRIPIECSLQIVSLDEAMEYEALSYTWGDPGPTHPIICDGKTILIRSNLFQALRRLRYRVEYRH